MYIYIYICIYIICHIYHIYTNVFICIHTHNGVLLSHKKDEILPCANMDGPKVYYAK